MHMPLLHNLYIIDGSDRFLVDPIPNRLLTICLTGLRNSALDEHHCSIASRRTGGVRLDRSFEWRILRMMNDTPYNPTRARLVLDSMGQFVDRDVGAVPVPTKDV